MEREVIIKNLFKEALSSVAKPEEAGEFDPHEGLVEDDITTLLRIMILNYS